MPVPVRRPISTGRSCALPVLDHVGDEALLAGLDRAFGHHHRVLVRLGGEGHLGEEAGLQLAGVLHPGQHLDLARGGVGDVAHVVDRARRNSRAPSGPTWKRTVCALLGPQRLAPPTTLKRSRRRLVSTRVASTCAGLHELPGLHRLGVDHAGARADARSDAAQVLARRCRAPPWSAARPRSRRSLSPRAPVQLLGRDQLLLRQLPRGAAGRRRRARASARAPCGRWPRRARPPADSGRGRCARARCPGPRGRPR